MAATGGLGGSLFDLSGRVAVITGGGGFLGERHAEAIAAAGGTPVLSDIRLDAALQKAERLSERFGVPARAVLCDVTQLEAVERLLSETLEEFGRVDVLINNAANDPKVDGGTPAWARVEQFPLEQWDADIRVGLTGAFLCARVIGGEMARRGGGVILNVASDLSVIAPDQRVYRLEGLEPDHQPVKPISYSVTKTGLIGLTRYLATYWADRGVRVNAISPGGVYNGQPEDFVRRLENLIPMGRMAGADDYQGAVVFLCSDASAYMTGHNLVVDGGRSCW